MRESHLQSDIRDAALKLGWLFYHTYDSRRSDPGFPDCVLARPPDLIFAELKSEDGRATPEQLRWMDVLHRAGQEVYLWRPSDWDAIINRLSRRSAR